MAWIWMKQKCSELGQSRKNFPSQIDTMHICLPCSNQQNFTDITVGYVEEFKPKLVIINSTVPPGTTMKVAERCKCLVAHSPSRGVHKSAEHMKWEMRRWTKYVGGANPEAAAKQLSAHFEKIGLKVKILEKLY